MRSWPGVEGIQKNRRINRRMEIGVNKRRKE
jgi:hypothetical protein